MKLTVFGATGGTGAELIRLGLAAGHEITAVARRPEAVSVTDERLTARAGDVTRPETLHEAVQGADAVLSALGSRQMGKPTTVYSDGTAAILAAMEKAGVRRLVCVSAAPVGPPERMNMIELRVVRPILYLLFGQGYRDMYRMEQLLAGSDVDWTVFRPPRLLDKPARGDYRTSVDTALPSARSIARADLAAAMLESVGNPELYKHVVNIAY